MGIIGSCFARQCKSDVMHHGGVQGYQVRMTGMNQIHHMMPLLGSCSPILVCDMPRCVESYVLLHRLLGVVMPKYAFHLWYRS
jgi:hypothetical protein